MLCRDDGFPTPRIQHFEDITLCDYITAYRDLTQAELFSYLPNVQWEKKVFDVTVGADNLDNERQFMSFFGNISFSLVDLVIEKSLEYLFRKNRRSRAAEGFLREVLASEEATRIAILAAHGERAYGEWHYYESNIPVAPVQAWIDEQSRDVHGKKRPEVLLLTCCNPGNFKPKSKGIPVLYATGIVGVEHEYTYHMVK